MKTRVLLFVACLVGGFVFITSRASPLANRLWTVFVVEAIAWSGPETGSNRRVEFGRAE